MVKTWSKKWFIMIFIITNILVSTFFSYAKAFKTENDKIDILYLLKIIDDKDNLTEPLTRKEFAKMIVKSSDAKDKITGIITESVCEDVKDDNIYSGYIKEVIDKGHMFTYLGGLFKPDEYVTYSDLSRAMLSLLGYKSDDFRGNQVLGRNIKFESLKLNENIDKTSSDILYKIDVINGIYNTLKENKKDTNDAYGLTIFDKLIVDSDNELNADEYIEKKVEGPFIIKNVNDITAPFEITNYNVYLNGVKSDIEQVKYDMSNYGYVIFYLDLDREYVYAYTERDDVVAPIQVRKGYIVGIYYSAKDTTTPYRVDIESRKYMLESEEVKFAFSAFGYLREGDYIVYLCNKMNDVTKAYIDENGKVVRNNDESEIYNGSIINAYSYDMFKDKE